MDAPAKLKVSWFVIPYIGNYTIMIINRQFSQCEAGDREVSPVCVCMYVTQLSAPVRSHCIHLVALTLARLLVKGVNGTRALFM